MNVTKKIHDAKLIEWAALFKGQAESGLKVIDWCASKGISKDTYYYWKHQLKKGSPFFLAHPPSNIAF